MEASVPRTPCALILCSWIPISIAIGKAAALDRLGLSGTVAKPTPGRSPTVFGFSYLLLGAAVDNDLDPPTFHHRSLDSVPAARSSRTQNMMSLASDVF